MSPTAPVRCGSLALLLVLLAGAAAPAHAAKRKAEPALKTLEQKVRLLWIPVDKSRSCETTCNGVGLANVGDSTGQLCSVAPYGPEDYWYEGFKTPTGPCTYVTPEDAVASVGKGYFCGCLPRKGASTDSSWTAGPTAACKQAKKYSRIDFVCRVQANGKTYLGWESVPVDGPPVKTCVYPNGTEVGESATYSRLCGPNKFAFMVDVNCKLCSAA